MNTLTFVFGANHYHATQWIRKEVQKTGRFANEFRNITNPDTVRGLKSTENTTIEFVWLDGCALNKQFEAFRRMIQLRQDAGAKLVELRRAFE